MLLNADQVRAMKDKLIGKKIIVQESGYSAEGVVKRVDITSSNLTIRYAVAGEKAYVSIGFAWNYGSCSLQNDCLLRIHVPMVGDATIKL